MYKQCEYHKRYISMMALYYTLCIYKDLIKLLSLKVIYVINLNWLKRMSTYTHCSMKVTCLLNKFVIVLSLILFSDFVFIRGDDILTNFPYPLFSYFLFSFYFLLTLSSHYLWLYFHVYFQHAPRLWMINDIWTLN